MNRIRLLGLHRLPSLQKKIDPSSNLGSAHFETSLDDRKQFSTRIPRARACDKSGKEWNLLGNYKKGTLNRYYCVNNANESDKIQRDWPNFGGKRVSAPGPIMMFKNRFNAFFIRLLIDPDFKLKEILSGTEEAFKVAITF